MSELRKVERDASAQEIALMQARQDAAEKLRVAWAAGDREEVKLHLGILASRAQHSEPGTSFMRLDLRSATGYTAEHLLVIAHGPEGTIVEEEVIIFSRQTDRGQAEYLSVPGSTDALAIDAALYGHRLPDSSAAEPIGARRTMMPIVGESGEPVGIYSILEDR